MTLRSKRLARILRIRKVQEEQARALWLEAELAATRSEERASELGRARRNMVSHLGERLCGLPPAWVLLSHEQLERVGQKLRIRRERARTLRSQAEAAREPWAERRTAAKGLERLLERAKSKEYMQALALETRELDELNMERAARRPRSEQ